MKIGDLILLHVGQQNKKYESGIYAIGKVITEPYILKNHPQDYCNNKNTVDVKIEKINYSKPIIIHEKCKEFINQFRTFHIIDEFKYELVFSILQNSK